MVLERSVEVELLDKMKTKKPAMPETAVGAWDLPQPEYMKKNKD